MAHLITLKDWSREQIEEVLSLAAEMKRAPEKFQDVMRGKMPVMIFEKQGNSQQQAYRVIRVPVLPCIAEIAVSGRVMTTFLCAPWSHSCKN
ncbi:hypothetical protein ES703_50855 [subsurface metagenome]